MILLDDTTKLLEAKLGAAGAIPFISSYIDIDTTTHGISAETANDGVTNGTTEVTIVGAPGANTVRQVKYVLIYNDSGGSVDLTVRYNDNGTIRSFTYTLSDGEELEYTDGQGWEKHAIEKVDANGFPWRRTYEEYLDLSSVELTTSDSVLIDGSADLGNDSALLYKVWYKVVNIDGSNSAYYTIGKDVAAGGGLASPEYWDFQVTVPAGGDTGWIYGGIVAGDDDVRGLAENNSYLVVQFEVQRVDPAA